MVNCSAKIVYNPQRIRKDGTVLLYLRIIIGGQKKDIDLKLYWPKEKFDRKNRRCLPLSKSDTSYRDHNILLADSEARATEIFVQYRLRRVALTLDTFLFDFRSGINRDDVISYFETKLNQRHKDGEISFKTLTDQTVTLNHLKTWKTTLLFSDLNNRTAFLFDKFLKDKTGCKKINSRWSHHKNFRTYLNAAAKKDNLQFVNPYQYFSAKTETSRFQPLTKDQFLQFWDYYNEPLIYRSYRPVIRAFLFSCVTGMRHSDLRRFDLEKIDGEFFEFIPFKTRRFGTKVRMPITKMALDLIADEIDEVGEDKMFRSYSEQKSNQYINEVATHLEIKMKVCFQIARETFATLYMEHDGKLEVLSSFMGHKNTRMTEKYIKIRDQRKKQEAIRISSFINRDQ